MLLYIYRSKNNTIIMAQSMLYTTELNLPGSIYWMLPYERSHQKQNKTQRGRNSLSICHDSLTVSRIPRVEFLPGFSSELTGFGKTAVEPPEEPASARVARLPPQACPPHAPAHSERRAGERPERCPAPWISRPPGSGPARPGP